MSISHLIGTYGYWAVFALVAAESVGIPMPGETALIIAAAYAGHTHHLSPWVIFVVALAGAIAGDNIGYLLFDTHGPKVVFFGRFILVLRTYAAFLAGTSRMRWHRFLLANATGAITWAGAYTLAAYLAGDTLRHLSGTIDLALGGASGLTIAALLLTLRQQAGRLALRAEAAYPGPLK